MSGDRNYAKPDLVRAVTKNAVETVLDDASPNYVLRTLLVLIHTMLAHNRLADAVSRGYIARTAGVSERQVTRALRRLSDLDVLLWMPGASPPGGKRRPGRVSFHPPPDRGVSDQGSDVPPGRLSTNDRGVSAPRPGSEVSPSQVLSRRKESSGASAASAGATGGLRQEEDAETQKDKARLRDELHGALYASGQDTDTELDDVADYLARFAPILLAPVADQLAAENFAMALPRNLLRMALDREDGSPLANLGDVVEAEGSIDYGGELSAGGSLLSTGRLPSWWKR